MSGLYANLAWTAADITSRTMLSEDEAVEFLEKNGKHLRDRLSELGNQIIGDLLDCDSIPRDEAVEGLLHYADVIDRVVDELKGAPGSTLEMVYNQVSNDKLEYIGDNVFKEVPDEDAE